MADAPAAAAPQPKSAAAAGNGRSVAVGEVQFAVGAPNAERLVKSTGYSPTAMGVLLEGPVMAGTVAAALIACIKTKARPDRHKLACAIEAAGANAVRAEVRALYPQADEGVTDDEAES